ncbi:Heat shock protein 70 [[Leptolyngbya] sp. PCC 7376]|uniref:Hsp70 family protein n=1 Tax=[Leptolyngbya] sp. PCC 7376 TaxID=111781 RepID=UPI00029F338B|nr:Hsp70 family protein [[Leptolyngbya] sp. PCC 7376]AFY37667.1 Heat shock protein 70 [[Leptolyngbya] sp. PCC 7376]
MAIAIDFGTSNTLVTRWNVAKNEPEVLALDRLSQQLVNNPPLIPSQLYVADASKPDIILGQAVGDRGLDGAKDQRLYRNFKRGIGTSMQGFLPELDGQKVTFEKLGNWFLSEIFQQLQQQENIDSLVMTVPVDSFESYRSWLTDVCADLPNIDKIQLLDEPTAAALGYGALEQELKQVLVVDFGGGTVDFSLVELNLTQGQSKPTGFILRWAQKSYADSTAQKAKTAKVIAKAGKNLGGSDLDNWLFDYFQQQQNLPKDALSLRLIERLKIKLSEKNQATEVYYNAETFESIELSLDRPGFETILQEQGFLGQLDELMSQVLQQARRNGVNKDDIEAVLLVGGTSQIPTVQTWLKSYFPEEKIKNDNPFGAIAAGALQLAQGFELKDFLYHSYGIRYWNRRNKCHDWHPIIPQGQPYPMSQPIELTLGASIEQQPNIELIIGELGEKSTGTEIYFDGDRLVTKNLGQGQANVKPLNDRDGARTVAKLDPVGYPGSDRIKLQFLVDGDRCLRVTVEDLLRNLTLLENQKVAEIS